MVCDRVFDKRNTRTIHLKVYHSVSKILSCRHCDEEFVTSQALKAHLAKSHATEIEEQQVRKNTLKQVELAQKLPVKSALKSTVKASPVKHKEILCVEWKKI